MGALVNITGSQTLNVNTSASTLIVPPLSSSIDVSGFDILDLEWGCSQNGPGASSTIYMITSMQNDVDDISLTAAPSSLSAGGGSSWLNFASFGPGTSLPKFAATSSVLGFFRFVRWAVWPGSGSGQVAFWIRGVARRYGA